MKKMNFPSVKGSNLEKKKYNLPDDFEGKVNIVTIAFQQWQQGLVDTWVPFLSELKRKFPDIFFYELPTINRGYKGIRFIIDGGMRMGIPAKEVRERTITLYLDKKKFMTDLMIENDEDIHTFLLDSNGKVILRIKGEFKHTSATLIDEKLEKILK